MPTTGFFAFTLLSSMAELSGAVPLLTKREEFGYSKRRPILQILAKLVLKSLMWLIFLVWVSAIFLYPTDFMRTLFSNWKKLTGGSIFGYTGSIFLGFSAPVLIIASLAYIYVATFSGENFEKRSHRFPRYRLSTFPVLVDGPFGVVSAAEMIGILLFAAYVLCSVTIYAIHDHRLIERFLLTLKERSALMLGFTGVHLGLIGLFCLAFLFLPVARGSILLRMIDIPFEQAARYHVWLGHLTMAIFTLHGLFLMISWAMQGKLLQEILGWGDTGISHCPGVISLAAGLLMWLTSLRPVRRNYFELFFYTHQLYVIFVFFLALHVGDSIFSYAAGAIFLFILDRFLRFCQSRSTVDILSAACGPCGTVELILSKPPGLQYNALSFVFLQVRELSWLQWHPFSVSSSPLDCKHHLSVLIKGLGQWAANLRDIITSANLRDIITSVSELSQKDLPSKLCNITASVEGPYGHESPYHLMYENLILVAGGIGISPFFAILSDILHLSGQGKPCLPKNILVVWAVKKSKEVSLLSTIDWHSICPSISNKLHLEIQTYVTQESDPSLEDGIVIEKMECPSLLTTPRNTMSCLVGTGHTVWAGAYVLVSTFGFIVLYALLELYYLKPLEIFSWWYKGLLMTLCMVASVVILGTILVFFWYKWGKKSSCYERWMVNNNENKSLVNHNGLVPQVETSKEILSSVQSIKYGFRPDFRAIFGSFAEQVGHVNVGVIVCGPPSLQSSVARECRYQNIRGKWNHPIFHFNSHSFDL